jgi:hypothetical protein
MLSSISSIIWGVSSLDQDGPSPPTTTIHMRGDSLDEDDWVVVGRIAQFPGTLVGTFPLPESYTPMMISPAMSEDGDVEEKRSEPSDTASVIQNTKRAPRSRPTARMLRRMEVKDLKSAQLARQRSLGKSSSRKMLKRSNKAALCGRRAGQSKMVQRNLKQC